MMPYKCGHSPIIEPVAGNPALHAVSASVADVREGRDEPSCMIPRVLWVQVCTRRRGPGGAADPFFAEW